MDDLHAAGSPPKEDEGLCEAVPKQSRLRRKGNKSL